MPLRKANTADTERFEDGDAWLELRLELTKSESDRVKDLTARVEVDPSEVVAAAKEGREPKVELGQQVERANQALFGILAQAWSLGSGKPGAADYAVLDEESGRWVDDCIEQALVRRRERAVKNVSSSKKRTARATSSAPAAASS